MVHVFTYKVEEDFPVFVAVQSLWSTFRGRNSDIHRLKKKKPNIFITNSYLVTTGNEASIFIY